MCKLWRQHSRVQLFSLARNRKCVCFLCLITPLFNATKTHSVVISDDSGAWSQGFGLVIWALGPADYLRVSSSHRCEPLKSTWVFQGRFPDNGWEPVLDNPTASGPQANVWQTLALLQNLVCLLRDIKRIASDMEWTSRSKQQNAPVSIKL